MIERAPDGQWRVSCVACLRKAYGGSFDKWDFVSYLKHKLGWELREFPWARWYCPECRK